MVGGLGQGMAVPQTGVCKGVSCPGKRRGQNWDPSTLYVLRTGPFLIIFSWVWSKLSAAMGVGVGSSLFTFHESCASSFFWREAGDMSQLCLITCSLKCHKFSAARPTKWGTPPSGSGTSQVVKKYRSTH